LIGGGGEGAWGGVQKSYTRTDPYFVHKISTIVSRFCLLRDPRSTSYSLIWTLNFTSNFLKSTNYFYRMNGSQNESLLELTLKYALCRGLKISFNKSRFHSDITVVKHTHKIR